MEQQLWLIKTSSKTYHITCDKHYLRIDGRRIELPESYRNTSVKRIRMPIDEVNCWCVWTPLLGEIEVFVDDTLIQGEIIQDPPMLIAFLNRHKKLKESITLSLVLLVCIIGIICMKI